ncbi:hypothetical protein ASG12_07615 [Williamsia sp. Leaf354]|uniref:hypothetical protein n=1 Tax=Williamsia sp. Leaf354 TaxID=1736349 RepID=UPI0006F2D6CD|nr:hypothetical protein [Williamsia sp. Leaf354]KQS00721.1 hypothetical protein ASG12_07615 [Williamsia sp. Leaf354]
MSSTQRRFVWVGAALGVVIAAVVATVVIVGSGGDDEAPRVPITEPKQGLLQKSDPPDGYTLETAGTATGSAEIGAVSPPECARALQAQNTADAKKVSVLLFAEPPSPDLVRYQQTVYRDGADLAAIRESARACPQSVETSGTISSTLNNTLQDTPAGCPDGAVVVETRSALKAAGTMNRQLTTASVQNGRVVTQLAQEWTSAKKPDLDERCRLTSIALKRLSTTAGVTAPPSSPVPQASEFCRHLTADDVATVFADTSLSKELTYRDDAPTSPTSQQCSWLVNMNTLDMEVADASGGPSSITVTVDKPVDVGGGATFYRSRAELDGTCSGEFYVTSQPDKSLKVAAIPLTDVDEPAKPVEPLCTALITAGTKVLRALGWTQ